MDIKFNKNEDHNKLLLSDLKRKLAKVKLGGGEKRIEKHHSKGKLTARERIDYLVDDPKKCIEIGAFAGEELTCTRDFYRKQITDHLSRR